ncbi:MAG: SMP-30/gluconolactonase/LRE family protein [Hyphomicrobium sp.]
MRSMTGAVLLLGLAAASAAHAAEPARLWQLGGFENPESALPDLTSGTIYVSNVAGDPTAKDGNGYISKATIDGKLTAAKWVTGLDAPKGMALVGGVLFVADIDQLIEIDTKAGKIAARHPASGAKFLNDVAADAQGRVYVSDMATNTIWRLADGKFESWLQSDSLKNPNGLLVEGDTLIVAAWGKMTDGFATKVPGNLLAVSLADKSIKDLGDGAAVGNLDGIEPLGNGTYVVSDWMSGKVFKIAASGKAEQILALTPGAADLGYSPGDKTMFLPMMKDNTLDAYRIE